MSIHTIRINNFQYDYIFCWINKIYTGQYICCCVMLLIVKSAGKRQTDDNGKKMKIRCRWNIDILVSIPQFVMTTVEFLTRWVQHRSNVALNVWVALSQQLCSVHMSEVSTTLTLHYHRFDAYQPTWLWVTWQVSCENWATRQVSCENWVTRQVSCENWVTRQVSCENCLPFASTCVPPMFDDQMKNIKMTNKTLHRKLKNPTPLKTFTYHYMFFCF
jgi:hypothetical protein